MERTTPPTAPIAVPTNPARVPWQAMGANALTEAATRVDLARLHQLGYVVQANANGTVTFWHPQHIAEPLDGAGRQKHLQHLLAAGALRDGE